MKKAWQEIWFYLSHIHWHAFCVIIYKKMKGTAAFVKRQSSEYCHPKHTFMITLFYENDKLFNQDTYDNIISQIDLSTLECPTCHHSGCLIKHARYNRTFRVSHSIITVKITRVLCKECGHTHAILLCDFVPYSQILIDDQLDIGLVTLNWTVFKRTVTIENQEKR